MSFNQTIKKCVRCGVEKDIESFSKEPTKSNPEWRRRTCKECKNKQNREYLLKNNIHKIRYWKMSSEQREEYNRVRREKKRAQKTNPAVLEKKRAFDKTDKGIWNRYNGECRRRSRNIRGIKMELTFEQFCSIINSSCTYCGEENCRGVDRIDSNLSYTIENSIPSCKICNRMKSDLKPNFFKQHVLKMAKRIGSL